MRIILSPAKKMKEKQDMMEPLGIPEYVSQTEEILLWLRNQTHEDLQKLWKCNDKIAQQNFERLEQMNLYSRLTPAILSYEGIAYQYMAPAIFEDGQLCAGAFANSFSILWCIKANGWGDTVPVGNAGQGIDWNV